MMKKSLIFLILTTIFVNTSFAQTVCDKIAKYDVSGAAECIGLMVNNYYSSSSLSCAETLVSLGTKKSLNILRTTKGIGHSTDSVDKISKQCNEFSKSSSLIKQIPQYLNHEAENKNKKVIKSKQLKVLTSKFPTPDKVSKKKLCEHIAKYDKKKAQECKAIPSKYEVQYGFAICLNISGYSQAKAVECAKIVANNIVSESLAGLCLNISKYPPIEATYECLKNISLNEDEQLNLGQSEDYLKSNSEVNKE